VHLAETSRADHQFSSQRDQTTLSKVGCRYPKIKEARLPDRQSSLRAFTFSLDTLMGQMHPRPCRGNAEIGQLLPFTTMTFNGEPQKPSQSARRSRTARLISSESIQLFAGATEIFNRTVRSDDYIAAGQEIRNWALTPEAISPVKQAAAYLEREIVRRQSYSEPDSVMRGWCVYLSFVSAGTNVC
jgi:hypothetical protein